MDDPTRSKKLKDLFRSEIDKAMNRIFGKSAAKTVYYYLDKNYSMRLEDIPEKPEVFSKALENMFGELGAEVIEALLIRTVSSNFKVKYQKKGCQTFSDYLNELIASNNLNNERVSEV